MFKHTSIEELYLRFVESGQKVCTDTRKIEENAIFFALRGPNFNANKLAAEALASGCSFAVIDEEAYAFDPRMLLVKDVLEALQQLANHHRKQFSIPVLAITGSNGKTTHKELINAVLSTSFDVLCTKGNLNNHIGVPLTLLGLRKQHGFAIIEMGANHVGEINALCNIAEPDYGLITNIGKAHLEGFGGIEGVKQGKSELYRFLQNHKGLVFLNGDDEVLQDLARLNNSYTYGTAADNKVRGIDLSVNGMVSFKYSSKKGETDWSREELISTGIVGNYNFINCLAAACVADYFKVPFLKVKAALEAYRPDMNRSQLVRTAANVLILDAYNANPNSMKAALENFAGYPAEKKMVLLGDMFELGEYSEAEHHKVVSLVREKKFDEAVLVGPEFAKAAGEGVRVFADTAGCRRYLESLKPQGFTILIKGSRGMKMESLQDAL